MKHEVLYQILRFGMPAAASCALAWLSVRCRPDYTFRSDFQQPLAPECDDVDFLLDQFPDTKQTARKEISDLVKELQEYKSFYQTLEDRYNSDASRNTTLFLFVCPLICLLSVLLNLNLFSWPVLLVGLAVFFAACSLFRSRGVMSYAEQPVPDYPLVPPFFNSADDFLTFWRYERDRSHRVTSERWDHLPKLLDRSSRFQSVFSVITVVLAVYTVVTLVRK